MAGRDTVLVTTEWLNDHLDDPDIRILEVDEDTSAYESKRHIPGALAINWTTDLPGPDPPRPHRPRVVRQAAGPPRRDPNDAGHPLRRQQQLVRCLRLLVLQALRPRERAAARRRPRRLDRRGAPPHRRRADRDGDVGLPCADRRRVATGPSRPRRGLPRRRRRQARRRALAGGVPGRAAGAGPPAERGRERPGHIPGAVNIPWGKAVDATTGRFLGDDELVALYGGQGIDDGGNVIAYCRIGERSAHTWFVLHELLGYPNVRNYDGSWTEWGSLIGVPIER